MGLKSRKNNQYELRMHPGGVRELGVVARKTKIFSSQKNTIFISGFHWPTEKSVMAYNTALVLLIVAAEKQKHSSAHSFFPCLWGAAALG